MIEFILFSILSMFSAVLFVLGIGTVAYRAKDKGQNYLNSNVNGSDNSYLGELDLPVLASYKGIDSIKEDPSLTPFETYRQAAKVASALITGYAQKRGVKLKKLAFSYDESDHLTGESDMGTPGYSSKKDSSVVINHAYADSIYKSAGTVKDLAKKYLGIGLHEVGHLANWAASEGKVHGEAMAEMVKLGYTDTVDKIQDWMGSINNTAYQESNKVVAKDTGYVVLNPKKKSLNYC
ncbi:MAG: hypothetical protein K0B02_00025 [DPANN group archaeon]|nr:hypothetical protein [DPANN group archaeon]